MLGSADQRQRSVLDRRPLGRQPGGRRRDRLQEGVVRADHRNDAVGAVFGLGGEVERDQLGVGGRVRDHQQLRGAGDAVDAHQSHDLALGLLHVGVAGPDDHVHRSDRVGSVRKRRDRLCAAHQVDLVDAAEATGRQDRAARLPIAARWRCDGDLPHARDARGLAAHHHRGGIGRSPSGDVHAHAPDRQLPQRDRVALVLLRP